MSEFCVRNVRWCEHGTHRLPDPHLLRVLQGEPSDADAIALITTIGGPSRKQRQAAHVVAMLGRSLAREAIADARNTRLRQGFSLSRATLKMEISRRLVDTREIAAGMAFHPDYHVKGNKRQQTRAI